MKRKTIFMNAVLLIAALAMVVTACKKDDDDDTPKTFTLTGLSAGTIDMNGATPPSDIPANPTITATFSANVNTSTATNANITLTRDYDDADVPLTITVTGKTITIEPAEGLGSGALHLLSFGTGLKSTDGVSLAKVDRSFTTEGAFVPAGQVAFYNFNDSYDDQTGTYNPTDVIDVDFVDSRTAAQGKAGSFNGNTSLIRIPNGDMIAGTNDFTLAFWVKANSDQAGQFVMGLSGWYGFQFEISGDYKWCKLAAQYEFEDGTSGSEDLWFAGDGNLGWQGWTFCKDLTTAGGVEALLMDEWAHVVCRYDSESKKGTMYINGEKMKDQDFNLWPDGDPKQTVTGLKWAGNTGNNTFVLGFIQDYENPTIPDDWADYTNPDNNHFHGLLDDVAIYHRALSEQEISLMAGSK